MKNSFITSGGRVTMQIFITHKNTHKNNAAIKTHFINTTLAKRDWLYNEHVDIKQDVRYVI